MPCIRLMTLQRIRLTVGILQHDLPQAQHVGNGHAHVSIVVPRDKAAMPHGSQQSPRVYPIQKAMRATNIVEKRQHVKQSQLSTAELRAIGIILLAQLAQLFF